MESSECIRNERMEVWGLPGASSLGLVSPRSPWVGAVLQAPTSRVEVANRKSSGPRPVPPGRWQTTARAREKRHQSRTATATRAARRAIASRGSTPLAIWHLRSTRRYGLCE